jgi:hypothetical protein
MRDKLHEGTSADRKSLDSDSLRAVPIEGLATQGIGSEGFRSYVQRPAEASSVPIGGGRLKRLLLLLLYRRRSVEPMVGRVDLQQIAWPIKVFNCFVATAMSDERTVLAMTRRHTTGRWSTMHR